MALNWEPNTKETLLGNGVLPMCMCTYNSCLRFRNILSIPHNIVMSPKNVMRIGRGRGHSLVRDMCLTPA